MGIELIIVSFMAIALMRVVQKVSAKKVSKTVKGKIFFHYGEISVFIDGESIRVNELLTDCMAVDLTIEREKKYRIELLYTPKTVYKS